MEAAPLPSQAATPTTRKPSCNPPYTINAQGDREYKTECIN
jgi:hypothetical protein